MKFTEFSSAEHGTIYIPDEVDPQNYATLAAWFSRSTETVPSMVEKINSDGVNNFMEKFFIGYGHESIGDLVDVKLFIQGIPLYLAPLLEHHAKFRGQESSTRYIDFSKQRLFGPDQEIMQAQIQEYLAAVDVVSKKLLEHNKPETQFQKNAVLARTFDICRGLLPLGTTTNVAWFGDIRAIKGHLAWMLKNHPWSEPWVDMIFTALRLKYPASMEKNLADLRPHDPWITESSLDNVKFKGEIDFGSWRDLNRHRIGRHTFNLPQSYALFHSWYVDMLGQCGFKIDRELAKRASDSDDIGTRQFGQKVSFVYEMPRFQAKYFYWRRNQLDVHPTLRLPMQEGAISFGFTDERIPDVGLGYVERRGHQTIIHKGSV